MNKKALQEKSKSFADATQVSQKQAETIMKIIYDKGLDAKTFDRVLWRMKNLVMNTKVQELVNTMEKTQIESLVDELVVQDQASPSEVCCNENDEIHFQAFFSDIPTAPAEGKKFNAGDLVDIQIMRTGVWNHPMI